MLKMLEMMLDALRCKTSDVTQTLESYLLQQGESVSYSIADTLTLLNYRLKPLHKV